jgi:hypothetical protein
MTQEDQVSTQCPANRRVIASSPIGGAKSAGQTLKRVVGPLAVLTVCQPMCHRTLLLESHGDRTRPRGLVFRAAGFSGLAAVQGTQVTSPLVV